jgi:cation diffusion facilitator CzcD-associated flavoprotein CzcO
MLNTAIIGAGPYGLSIAAHLRRKGISFRIFGRPMDTWRHHMPVGMMLKSDGFASSLFDPEGGFTLKKFCADNGIRYADTGVPVSLDTFNAYGVAFSQHMVPELEEKQVEWVDRAAEAFVVRLEGGETVTARNVVLAVGITHFDNVPQGLVGLPAPYVTHSSAHREVEAFRGRSVAVIGAGASALDLAGLLHEAGADVQIISRKPELKFHSAPAEKPRTF